MSSPIKPTKEDKERVLKLVEENNIRFVRFWFTDVLGNLKSFSVTAGQLETAFDEGMGFDGSSIEGFARIQESDTIAYPDASTFQILPWYEGEHSTARMFCNIFTPDDKPYAACPRHALARTLAKAEAMGLTLNVGPELEYYYLKSPEEPEPVDRAGYFDLMPDDIATGLRRSTVLSLEKMGIPVEYSHHECGPSQQEIDLRYTNALAMADAVVTYRFVVKEEAKRHGLYATFMPKPLAGEAGSGMHVHQSLFNAQGNVFFDANDPQGYNLSSMAKHYIAGLLKYAPEFTAVTNQYVNSYKRLVSGYEAPVYVSWARSNRSAMVRVPGYKPGKETATRIELRSADPACNPYLAFTVMLAAGLKGIEDELELPEEVTGDIFDMSEAELAKANVTLLPENLGQAIELFENSELMKETLGEHIHSYFVANKRAEWNEYRNTITPWELNRYLPVM